MTASTTTQPISEQTGPGCKHPGRWFCTKQSLKGCNSSELSLPPADLREKWILITGGNSGIGREAALQFAKWGANLVLGCREPPPKETHPSIVVEELKAAARRAGHEKSTVEYWEVDMGRLSTVEALGKRWLDTCRQLDILCNNAGISGALQSTSFSKDGFELVHQVNFLSHVLLTLTLLPSLAQSPNPRIICTTSNMQYRGLFNLSNANEGGDDAYGHNKLYFQTWLNELQRRLLQNEKFSHIVIHGVHPGYVKTNIWNSLEHSKQMSWGEYTLAKLLPYVGITAQQGSLCILAAATLPQYSLRTAPLGSYEVGGGAKFINRIWECEPMPETRDPWCRREIWTFVDKEMGLQGKGLLGELGV